MLAGSGIRAYTWLKNCFWTWSSPTGTMLHTKIFFSKHFFMLISFSDLEDPVVSDDLLLFSTDSFPTSNFSTSSSLFLLHRMQRYSQYIKGHVGCIVGPWHGSLKDKGRFWTQRGSTFVSPEPLDPIFVA